MDTSWVALRVIGAALIVTRLIVGLWVQDVWSDSKHTVRVKLKTRVFAGSGDEDCEDKGVTSRIVGP